eukprot:tig00000441_g723.t1
MPAFACHPAGLLAHRLTSAASLSRSALSASARPISASRRPRSARAPASAATFAFGLLIARTFASAASPDDHSAAFTTPELAKFSSMAPTARSIKQSFEAVEQMDGDGARVRRTIGTRQLRQLDPFLMLDEFFVEPPAGFPDHPHRGFETVTYMLDGAFTHRDNKGHSGTIGPLDLQWMTAGRGIIHSEMPATNGVNHGLQLWVNLKSSDKMCEAGYQELLAKDVPVAKGEGVTVRVIAGKSLGTEAKVYTRTPTMYLDVKLEPGARFVQPVQPDFEGFAYVLSGAGKFGGEGHEGLPHHCLVLGPGDELPVVAGDKGVRFVIVAGRPIGEPVVQHGPFVMNTREQIQEAIRDYMNGLF